MSDMNRPDANTAAAPEGSARRGFLGVAAATVGGTLLASGARLFDVQAATPTAGADASATNRTRAAARPVGTDGLM